MGVDVVDERKNVLVVAVVVLEGELDADVVTLGVDVDDLVVKWLLGRVEELDHFLQATPRHERFLLFLAFALVAQSYLDTLVQIRELAEAIGQRRVVIAKLGEDLRVGLEPHLAAAVASRGLAEHTERGARGSAHEVHIVLLAAAFHPDLELLRQRVHHRHSDAVQSARHLVAVLVELSAGVEHGHRQLDSGNLFSGMDVDRNAATIIRDSDRIVGVNHQADLAGVAGERFVDGVVDDFVSEVMQPARRRRTDVHSGTFAYRCESLQNLNLSSVVSGFAGRGSLRHYVRLERKGRYRTHPEKGTVRIALNLHSWKPESNQKVAN
jgi:hypothetical protein